MAYPLPLGDLQPLKAVSGGNSSGLDSWTPLAKGRNPATVDATRA